MDTLTAARLQMTLSLAFHMVFAAVGIGLPLLMVIVEGLWLRTGEEHYRALAKKWAKATGLLFAVGAVSGTALSFELGLLWPRYMELTGRGRRPHLRPGGLRLLHRSDLHRPVPLRLGPAQPAAPTGGAGW